MRKQTIVRALAPFVLLALFGCSHSNGTSSDNSSSNSPSSDNSAPPPAPAPAPIVIPAGKVLTVTVDQDISTKTNTSGDAFAASLAEPVTVDGQNIIPTGTHATGTIVQAKAAGHLKGGSLLELTLDSISFNGQKYSVETSEFEEAGKGRGKRSLIGGGGGAAFGAIVGALAGG
ncbi:MAG: hypothetical protein WB460_09295, partial [Candidatus Acidiferrales bacterium]